MRYVYKVTPEAHITVIREANSDAVIVKSGTWPLYSTISLTQTQARDVAAALMAAGFDYSRQDNANPGVFDV